MNCPKCGAKDLWRDSADVGVGIIWGPYGCDECGWSESEEYDLSAGRCPLDADGGVTDQWGTCYPPGNPVAALYRSIHPSATADSYGPATPVHPPVTPVLESKNDLP